MNKDATDNYHRMITNKERFINCPAHDKTSNLLRSSNLSLTSVAARSKAG